MLGTNISYDALKASVQDKTDEFQIEQVFEDNPLLSKVVQSEQISKYIASVTSTLIEYEKVLEHSIKFSNFQIFIFIAFFLLILIIAPSKFKTSLNVNEKSHKENIILNIIGRILTSLLMTILLLGNIIIQFLSINTLEKWGIQIIVNMILLLAIYYLTSSGKKSYKCIFLASFISSIAISIIFFITLAFSLLIANGNVVVATIAYTILFMSSLIIITYTIITSKELASSLLSK